MDCLKLEDVALHCCIGIDPREQLHPQPIRVSLALFFSTERAALSEALVHTVDYFALRQEVAHLFQEAQFHLLETAAEALAAYCFARHRLFEAVPPLERVRVKVRKLHSLNLEAFPEVEVERAGSITERSPSGVFFRVPRVELAVEKVGQGGSYPISGTSYSLRVLRL